jgi:hypothetical protein
MIDKIRTEQEDMSLAVDILMEEQLERKAGLRTDEILPPMPEEKESSLIFGGRWKTLLVGGALVVFFLGWVWMYVIEPRFDWFGPEVSRTASTDLSGSGATRGDDSSYFHSDKNLVRSIQSRLSQLGFSTGGVDGVVGPKTMESLQRFQMSRGLPATGVIDRATKQALDDVILPKGKLKPYMVARARPENSDKKDRFVIDLSVDPALSKEDVEKYVKEVTVQYARSNRNLKRFHVRAYLGIASLSAGAYAIADWERKGKDVRALEGFQIKFQEWTRGDVATTLPPAKSTKPEER